MFCRHILPICGLFFNCLKLPSFLLLFSSTYDMAVEKLVSLHTVGGNIKWCSHFGKHSGSSSNAETELLPYDPEILLLDIYPRYTPKRNRNTCLYENVFRTSLEVQWLRLCAPNEGGTGLIPGRGRSCSRMARSKKSVHKYS